ncbi:hypothetical protein BGW38_001081 [Lunasporangiospora selenospora]|uniref:EamA domain-containing protein n=1 Tax=Lunasporangiospora selenospora TaxID=979761 RepID=A0A9P6FU87_9FUNG|nr:hypothetical protein BGW38_001081 [Lunasporangiospora selenospora]
MNNIFAGQNYNKPFFVTYINTASFSFYLLGPLFRHRRQIFGQRSGSRKQSAEHKNVTTGHYGSTGLGNPIAGYDQGHDRSPTLSPVDDTDSASLEHGSTQTVDLPCHEEPPLTYREIADLSFTFCILWFAANWATNASLAYTTVASSTILASMSGFFTLAIGALLKTETLSLMKFVAVCMSVAGVALVSESDRGEGSSSGDDGGQGGIEPAAPLFGDFLALMSAFFYGCYTVLLKHRIQNESRVNMSLFFGFVGLFNIVLLWPMFGVLHWTGVEPFELPSDSKVIWMIVVNAIIGTFVSDYLWLLSMLMTSPLVVTLGLSLTIPLALLGDVVGYGRVLGLGYWIGAALVLGGFFGVNGVALSERNEQEREEEVAIRSAASCTTAAVAASALVAEERAERAEREPLIP